MKPGSAEIPTLAERGKWAEERLLRTPYRLLGPAARILVDALRQERCHLRSVPND